MAKRSPLDEKPFRPLDVSLLNTVVQHIPEARGSAAEAALEPARNASDPGIPLAMVRPAPDRVTVEPSAVRPESPVQRLDQERRILFTREEARAMDRLTNNLATRLQAPVKVSHIIRALTSLLLNAEREIDRRAGECEPLTRPPNGDFTALQRFERRVAVVLAHAFRDAGQPRQ